MNILLKVKQASDDFDYGSCAMTAIQLGFGISYDHLKLICDLMSIKHPEDGLTFFQCKKIINRIAKSGRTEAIYRPNVAEITYAQLVSVMAGERGIAMFPEHLSYFNDRVVVDSFIHDTNKLNILKYMARKPTGWWILKSQKIVWKI